MLGVLDSLVAFAVAGGNGAGTVPQSDVLHLLGWLLFGAVLILVSIVNWLDF